MDPKVSSLHPTPRTEACPSCASQNTRRSVVAHTFEYGDRDRVSISMQLPIWTCEECEQSFVTEEGERAKQDAIYKHLGLLDPRSIRKLRNDLGMSAVELAERTGLGVASIKRWESGSLMQSKSSDSLLRLLCYPENMERLKASRSADELATPDIETFQTKISDFAVKRSNVFQLRRA